MNQGEIGTFIAKCRKEKKLTQAQLAEKLNITDRAVSKWETGKSMPDSSIMLELCEILGITVNDLLSGTEVNVENYEKRAEEHLIALKRKEEHNMINKKMIAILFSGTLFLGIMICLICNIAISGKLTWSLIPACSIVFAWVLIFPSIVLGKRGIAVSLISFSIFTVPYLFLLSRLLKTKEVFSIGSIMAVISILFLWITVVVFVRIGTRRNGIAFGITFLMAIPFLFIINIVLSKMISEPILDIWDMATIFLLLILAFVSFMCNNMKNK